MTGRGVTGISGVCCGRAVDAAGRCPPSETIHQYPELPLRSGDAGERVQRLTQVPGLAAGIILGRF